MKAEIAKKSQPDNAERTSENSLNLLVYPLPSKTYQILFLRSLNLKDLLTPKIFEKEILAPE